MSAAHAPATERVLLDGDQLGRTLHRIAHEIIEANADLDQVALVGIHTRGVPLAYRLRRLIQEFSGVEVDLGTIDITFHRDDVHVRGGEAPIHPQPLVRETKLDDVRVEASKNRLTIVRPRSVGSFFISRSSDRSKVPAVASSRLTSSRVRSAMEIRCRLDGGSDGGSRSSRTNCTVMPLPSRSA